MASKLAWDKSDIHYRVVCFGPGNRVEHLVYQVSDFSSLFLIGKLMSALLSGLTDRNSVIQKSCAFAMGHLVRVS